jgi:hypothetical protein
MLLVCPSSSSFLRGPISSGSCLLNSRSLPFSEFSSSLPLPKFSRVRFFPVPSVRLWEVPSGFSLHPSRACLKLRRCISGGYRGRSCPCPPGYGFYVGGLAFLPFCSIPILLSLISACMDGLHAVLLRVAGFFSSFSPCSDCTSCACP